MNYVPVTKTTKLKVLNYVTKEGKFSVDKELSMVSINNLYAKKGAMTVTIIDPKDKIYREFDYKYFLGYFLTFEIYFERLVSVAISTINKHLPFMSINRSDINISMVSGLHHNGYYYHRTLKNDGYIEMRMSYIRDVYNSPLNRSIRNRVIKTIIHEIGHYLHDYMFDNKDFELMKYRGITLMPADKNPNENFAYAFANMIESLIEGNGLRDREKAIYSIVSSKPYKAY